MVLAFFVLVLVVGGAFFMFDLHPGKAGDVSHHFVVDDFGRKVSVAVKPKPSRIVSLAPSVTEILFALGLEDRVVGVTSFCDYPPEVLDRVRLGRLVVVGGFADPVIERIVALNPDLVLLHGSLQKKAVQVLEGRGLTVVALNPKNVSHMLQDIKLVGLVTGNVEEADRLVGDLQARIDVVLTKTRNLAYRPRVYYEVWYDPLMSAGRETWINELIEMAGGINIFSESKEPYPTVSSESVVQRSPEVIIVDVGYMGGHAVEKIKSRPGWSVVEAVRKDAIYEVDESLVLRPGPRIVKGLEKIAAILHPELFW